MLQTETIDGTIGQIESLYRTLTGREAPPASEQPYATMPPERSPEEHVEEQLDRLAECLADFSGRSSPLARWTPPIAVWQGANELLICIDLPGLPGVWPRRILRPDERDGPPPRGPNPPQKRRFSHGSESRRPQAPAA